VQIRFRPLIFGNRFLSQRSRRGCGGSPLSPSTSLHLNPCRCLQQTRAPPRLSSMPTFPPQRAARLLGVGRLIEESATRSSDLRTARSLEKARQGAEEYLSVIGGGTAGQETGVQTSDPRRQHYLRSMRSAISFKIQPHGTPALRPCAVC
jgi:hypothetical protein